MTPVLAMILLVMVFSECSGFHLHRPHFHHSPTIFHDPSDPVHHPQMMVKRRFPNIFELARQPFHDGSHFFSSGLPEDFHRHRHRHHHPEQQVEGSQIQMIRARHSPPIHPPPSMTSLNPPGLRREPYHFEPILIPDVSASIHEKLKEEIAHKIILAHRHRHGRKFPQPPGNLLLDSQPMATQSVPVKAEATQSGHSFRGPTRPYSFAYTVNNKNGNHFSQKETSDGNSISGSYSVLLPDGRVQTVMYMADKEHGYNAVVTYERPSSPSLPPPSPVPEPIQPEQNSASVYGSSSAPSSVSAEVPSSGLDQSPPVVKVSAIIPPLRFKFGVPHPPVPPSPSVLRSVFPGGNVQTQNQNEESQNQYFTRYASDYAGQARGQPDHDSHRQQQQRFHSPMAAIQIPLYHPPLLPSSNPNMDQVLLNSPQPENSQHILSYPLMTQGHQMYHPGLFLGPPPAPPPPSLASLVQAPPSPIQVKHHHHFLEPSVAMSHPVQLPIDNNIQLAMPVQQDHVKDIRPSPPDPLLNSEFMQAKLLEQQFAKTFDRFTGSTRIPQQQQQQQQDGNSLNQGQTTNFIVRYPIRYIAPNIQLSQSQQSKGQRGQDTYSASSMQQNHMSPMTNGNNNQPKFGQRFSSMNKVQKIGDSEPVASAEVKSVVNKVAPNSSRPILFNKDPNGEREKEFLAQFSKLPEPRVVRTGGVTGDVESEGKVELKKMNVGSQVNETSHLNCSSTTTTTTTTTIKTTMRPFNVALRRRVVKKLKQEITQTKD